MIHHRADERTGIVTETTILTGWNMSDWFVYSETSTMTRCAVIHDTCMTKRCRYKACGLVTAAAITVGWYMIRWRCFASGGNAIMTRGTVIHDACVIIACTDKGCGVMAH